jgi:poly(hydroxyalkanoate) depolymerase family esterase
MKLRMLDVMGEALSLVRKSNLSEATALLRNALSGEPTPVRKSDPDTRPQATGATTRLALQWNLAEPPYLLQKAPPADQTRARMSDAETQPQHWPAPAFAPRARRRLGEVLRELRVIPTVLPGGLQAPEPHDSQPHEFGERFSARTHQGAGGSMDYRLYVPADREQRNLALVLMLHGCTQDPEDFALGTQMNRLADEFGLIVAYPHQPRRANASGCWNWFDRRHQTRGSGEPDMLAGLAQALASEFTVGKDRIFAAGLSAGGAMAEILAATYPDVFEAIGVHSGLPYQSARDLPSAFAAMKGTAAGHAAPHLANDNARHPRKVVFHGGADQTVHPVNGERIRDQHRSDRPKRINLDSETAGGGVNRTVLQDPEGRTVVEHWFVETGGHAWFGGDPRGTYTQSVGVDASRIMVRFFLKR